MAVHHPDDRSTSIIGLGLYAEHLLTIQHIKFPRLVGSGHVRHRVVAVDPQGSRITRDQSAGVRRILGQGAVDHRHIHIASERQGLDSVASGPVSCGMSHEQQG